MALQLWLPLTKNLRNQGISSIQPTQTTGYTNVTAGKLGQCYKFTSTFDTLLPLSQWDWTTGSVSFGCWAKISKSELTTLVNAATYDSTYNSMGGTLLGRDSYGGLGLRWKTNNIYSSSTLSSVTIYVHMRNTNSSSHNTSAYTIPFDTWFHVMVVIDRNENKIKVYINGELFTTTNLTLTGTFNTGTFRIAEATWDGGNGRSSAGCWQLNDVRVYDNCLSATQIKEIAKGLVLHYPLTNKYIEPTTNLITTEDCLSATCYNGATSKYSYGTNTDMYKTVTTYDGKKGTKVYMGTNGNAAFPYVYISNMFTSDGTNQPAYKTLSFDYYTNIGTSIRPYKLGSGNGTATYKITNKNGTATGTGTDAVSIPVVTNGWNHIEITFHGTTAANSEWGYIQNYPQHTSNTSNFWFFANMQLETKDHATGYAGPGGVRNSNTVYDCSGFGYNGTLMTDTTVISNDITKYHVSTHFNGTYDGILIENLQLSDIINSAVTYAFWIKPEGESGARSVYFGSYSTGPSWSIEKTAGNVMRSYWNGSPDETCSGATITDGVWQHVCMVKEGTNSIKVYINGEQKWQSTAVHNNLSFPTTFRIGRDTRSNDGTPYKGLMSDFRIYATALSADDVKSLYQHGAYIDSIGQIHGKIH